MKREAWSWAMDEVTVMESYDIITGISIGILPCSWIVSLLIQRSIRVSKT